MCPTRSLAREASRSFRAGRPAALALSAKGTLRQSWRALAILALLAGAPAWAEPPAALTDLPRAARLGGPVTTGRGTLLMGTQLLALAATGAASVALGSLWIEDHFRIYGRPDPRVISASVAIALAVNLGLTWLLLPDLARVTNDAGGVVDPAFVRRETIRRTRWLALASALFMAVIGAGSVVEKNEFGRGQLVMAIGAGGAVLATLAFDLTALLTVRSATDASRQASEAPQ